MRSLWLGLVVCFSAGIGCGSDIFTWSDRFFDASCPNPEMSDTPCAGEGALCAGRCIPPHPTNWDGPYHVWMGAPADDPGCPIDVNGQPETAWYGYAGRNPPIQCGACSCGPSTGSCRLPTTFTAHATPQCPAPPGTAATSFNAPYMWNGSCTEANQILANATCPPGNTLCVQSLAIAPVTVDDGKCAPSVETPALVTEADPDPSDLLWETKARACTGDPRDNCPGGYYCSNVAPVNGWRQCVSRYGLYECGDRSADGEGGAGTGAGGAAGAGATGDEPSGWYKEKFVFYQDTKDTRTCSPCECGTPEGDSCMSQISIYSSAGCSGVPFWSKPVTSDLNSCETVPAGVALRSKEATEPVYTPGTCETFGGNPIGSVVGSNPVTVCCLPLP